MTRHVDASVLFLQRALSRVANDHYTPVPASLETAAYLDDLKGRYSDDQHPFNSFMLHLSVDALTDELISQALPDQKRDSILALRNELQQLQFQRDSEFAKGMFDNACDYRDRQETLANSLAKLIADLEFVATPSAINSALVSLGFDAKLLSPHKQ